MNSRFPILCSGLALLLAGPQLGCETWSRTLQAAALVTTLPSRTDALGWDNGLAEALPENFFPHPLTKIESGLVEVSGLSQDVTQLTVLEAVLSLAGPPSLVPLCESTAFPGYFTNVPEEDSVSKCGDNPTEVDTHTPWQIDIHWNSSTYHLYLPSLPTQDETTLSLTPLPTPGPSGHGPLLHPMGEHLTLEWTSQSMSAEPPPLIRVDRLLPISGESEDPPTTSATWRSDPHNPIFQSSPFPAASFATSVFAHILAPPENSTTLNGEEIFNIPGIYMLAFTPLHLSTTTSENLQLGSGSLVGQTRLILLRVE